MKGTKIKRKIALALAALMLISTVAVPEAEVVKAEETSGSTETTVAGNIPRFLSIVDGSKRMTIISDGKLQDDNVSDNADTVYQGTNWYYDSTKNHLVLENASISGNMVSLNGDLSIMLSGKNVVDQYISSEVTVSDDHTLEIDGNNYNGSLSCERISGASAGTDNGSNNMNITGATVETSQIICEGSLKIENSHIVVTSNDSAEAILSKDISITDSYVDAKTINTYGYGMAIDAEQKISVSGSQIVAESSVDSEQAILSDCDFSNSVITKKWKDADTGADVTKTYVYGTATLKEDLTIASGESIEFASGASITNLDRLTVEDGATILVDGVEHKHNTDVDFTYTWNDNTHTKAKFCPDCPIAYAAEATTDSHNYNAQGFCTECDAYQSAALTTDKYDINEDGSKDSVYEISNAGQLYWFAGLVNGTLPEVQQDRFANAVLTNDIIVNENVLVDGEVASDISGFRNWTTIAGRIQRGNILYGYDGIFDGQNHSISGIYCELSNMNVAYGGFFGLNEPESIVRNLSMKDSYIAWNKSGYARVGGIVGMTYGRIQGCSFDGLVNGSGDVGGICGENNGIIIDCYNSGRVEIDESSSGACGGICAINSTNPSNSGTIEKCYNTGMIIGSNELGGGICGYNSFDVKVKDCYNHGNVTVLNKCDGVGGICGLGEATASITNSYNTGTISGNENVGEIYGFLWSGTKTNCYYLSDNETDENGGMTGKTAEQFASGEVAYLLQEKHNGEDIVWGQNIGTDTYPVLGGDKVYANKKYCGHDEKEEDVIGIVYSNEDKAEFSHTLVKTDRVDAGCTTNGQEEYWTCSECGKMFRDENAKNEIKDVPVLAPLGHDYGLSVETSEDGTSSSVVFTCKRENCEESDEGHSETVTITAPDKGKLIFDGITKEATVTRTSQNVPENIPDIVYTGDDLLNGKPVNAGTYKASITIGDGENEVTASITYEIAQAIPVIGTVSADALNDTLDVSKVELKRSDNTLSGTLKLKDDTKLEYGTNEYTYVFIPDDSNYKQIEGAVNITVNDTIAPTASYKLGTDGWKKFINTITFGKFCKDYQTVEITYSDKAADGETDGSGIAKKQYYISDKEIENAQFVITDDMWTDYTKKVHLDANGTYFIYVRVSDNAGNEIIQNSEGVVIYAESTISPAESEYIYKEGKNCEFSVVLNGNTFNRLTDETGKDLAADSYTIGTDGKLTMKAAYLDTLKPGEYTYKLYMNPQGVATDKVELVYTFTVTVKQAEITVTGASAEDRPYDSTSNKVNISAVTISSVRDGEDVSIDTANLQGTLSSANAGSYTEVVLPQLTLTGADAANYRLVQPDGAVTLYDKVTISKLDSQITVGTESYDKTYGDAAFLLDATKNNTESEIIYTVTSGADVVSVDNGTVTIKKAGTATIKLSLAESRNYNAAEDKVVTVNVVKKSGYTVDALERSYLYLRENRESIDLTGLLPSDCGNVTYGNPVTSGDVTYSAAPKIENGVLSYTVGKGTAGNEGTVQTTVVTDNYADITITVHTKLVDQIPVKVKSGTEVTLKNSVITYGEALSEMLFDDAVFVDIADGKTVKGTLSWKDPAYKPNAGTASATWIFTPDSEDYAPLEGEISITVRKAVPQATAIPTVAERVYDPSKVLIDSDITGGTVTDVNGEPLAGKWSWQNMGIIPVVENEGYIAVFTPEDTANYEQISKTITVKVKKATPVIGTVSADALNDTLDVSKVRLIRTDNTLAGTLKLQDGVTLTYGTNEYTYVFTPDDSNYKQIEGAVSITVNDTIAPTASYRLGTDGWKKFINTITFGKFCKDYQTVEITYSDKAADGETDGSGIAKKQYYISDKEIENAQFVITDDMWTDYTKKVHLDANGTYFIYVRVSDNAGNEIIQNSEGVVIYAESTISPAESEYIYKEGKNCEFSVVLNGNTFNRLTDETGKDLAADSYTIGTDGKLTMKAAYLDTLKPGEYTYKLYMNPQGVATDKVELVYTFTVTVKQAEITVTGASAEDRPYDSTSNKVNISAVTISSVRDGEDVSIDTANLQGTLSSANAGSYTEVVLPQLTLTGADAANYRLVQPDGAVTLYDKVTISKLDSQITVGTESYDKTYGDAAFLLDATKNNTESEIIYTVTSGADVVSVDNGTVTIKKAGTATIKLSLAESRNYNAAESEICITVKKAPAAPDMPGDTINVSNGTKKVSEISLPENWVWQDADKDTALEVGVAVKATAVYVGADKGNYEIESVTISITRNDDNKGKPYIKDDNGKSGWKLITEQVEAAKTGETVTVEMNGTTTVPSDLFEQIKGKDINVVFDMDNGIKWTVNGKDVIEIKGDIDFGVTFGTEAGKTIPVDVINSITGEHTSMNLTLAYSGEFGFTATLTVNLKKENAGYYANLYYYNPDSNKLEFVCDGQIGKDGNVNLTFTHASDYTIVISDTAMDVNKTGDVSQNTDNNKTTDQNSKSETPKTGDVAWRSWWIILLGMGIIVVDVGKAAKRRNKNGI